MADNASPAQPKKFDFATLNKAVDAISPLIDRGLTAAGLPAKATQTSQPVRPAPKPTTPWLNWKYVGYGLIAAGGVGVIAALLRSGRRRR